jgi:hypothetical protein
VGHISKIHLTPCIVVFADFNGLGIAEYTDSRLCFRPSYLSTANWALLSHFHSSRTIEEVLQLIPKSHQEGASQDVLLVLGED